MFSLEHKHTLWKLRSQQLPQQQPPERGTEDLEKVSANLVLNFKDSTPPHTHTHSNSYCGFFRGCGRKGRDKH